MTPVGYFFSVICVTVVLIVVHAVISRRKRPPGAIGSGWTYQGSLLISFLLLLIYCGGVATVYFADVSWPHVGSKSAVFLFLLIPGILYQLYFLSFSLLKRKLPAKRLRARLLSIFLGLFLAAQLGQAVSHMAMKQFEQNCRPFVAMIEKNMPYPCGPSQSMYMDLLPHRRKNNMWFPGQRWHMYHNDQFFVLTFPGGSADIDGSTIYYSSQQGEWAIFHNDSKEDKKQLEELLKGMQICQQLPES